MAHSNQPPTHVAIIMDGNGRWAKERGLPRIEGHRRGVESVHDVVTAARDLKIKYLTLYAFSKENWERPRPEVNFLMTLLSDYLDSELKKMKTNGIRLQVIGKIDRLPRAIQEKILRNIEETKNETQLFLTLALSYSSRVEILEATKRLCRRVKSGELDVEKITESDFRAELDTAGIPDPDLLIRTSGELRVSNFLLWQISYTELYVSDKLWPDFHEAELVAAVEEFHRRERRFGRTEGTQVSP